MIEVNNLTKRQLPEALLQKTAERVLREEKKAQTDISIAIVGPKKSRELNLQYRKKDKAANVLSFEGSGPSFLGEVVLCPVEIEKDAVKYGMIFEQALAWMLVHGVLHLAGYDHKTHKEAELMEQKEARYLKKL